MTEARSGAPTSSLERDARRTNDAHAGEVKPGGHRRRRDHRADGGGVRLSGLRDRLRCRLSQARLSIHGPVAGHAVLVRDICAGVPRPAAGHGDLYGDRSHLWACDETRRRADAARHFDRGHRVAARLRTARRGLSVDAGTVSCLPGAGAWRVVGWARVAPRCQCATEPARLLRDDPAARRSARCDGRERLVCLHHRESLGKQIFCSGAGVIPSWSPSPSMSWRCSRACASSSRRNTRSSLRRASCSRRPSWKPFARAAAPS